MSKTEPIGHGRPADGAAPVEPQAAALEGAGSHAVLPSGEGLPLELRILQLFERPEVLLLGPSGLSLGRAPENQIRLSEPEVSRHHARVELVHQRGLAPMVLLSDLGSTNGTFVNGVQILPRNGPATLRGYLNGQPVDMRYDSAAAGGPWTAQLAMVPGANTLSVYADHPSGLFSTNCNSTSLTGTCNRASNSLATRPAGAS